MNAIIPGRRTYSEGRLDELRSSLDDLGPMLCDSGLSVYATGSYGRLEAWAESDVDLFFVYDDASSFSVLTFLRLAGRLVEKSEEMGFPPFSGDGEYLASLDINAIEETLGGRDDDSTNAFTARMLLLLESQPLSDPDRYAQLVSRVVGFYFRDHADHPDTFVPTFMTNDILRFWRTLTLNYEHNRAAGLRNATTDEELAKARAKTALKNYKLKVSRLSTCFSMLTHLASNPAPVLAEDVVALCRITPRERFAQLEGRGADSDAILTEIDASYEVFLERVQRPDAELLMEFADPAFRDARLAEAALYGARIYNLLQVLVPKKRMRLLVV